MEGKEKLIKKINYEKEWEKTLLCKISFGRIKPSYSWKKQLERINKKKNFLKSLKNNFVKLIKIMIIYNVC